MLLDLPDLLYRLLENGALVWLDVEVVHIVDVGEDQLGQLLNVLVLLLPVPPLCAPLGAAAQEADQLPPRRTAGCLSSGTRPGAGLYCPQLAFDYSQQFSAMHSSENAYKCMMRSCLCNELMFSVPSKHQPQQTVSRDND